MPRWLASRGEGVVTMRITFSEFSISTMYEELGMLISGNLTRCAYSVRLFIIKSCESRVPLSSYSPSTINGDNMLVLAHSVTLQKTVDIHPPKTGISVQFSGVDINRFEP